MDILEVIQRKCSNGNRINRLSTSEKVIYLIGKLESEVNNGGFSQYMFNSSGVYASKTIEYLQRLKADYTASLLAKAVDIYGNGPTSRGKDFEDLSMEQEESLDDLDQRFYEYKDDLEKLQMEFVKEHFIDF